MWFTEIRNVGGGVEICRDDEFSKVLIVTQWISDLTFIGHSNWPLSSAVQNGLAR